jgi:hypothetical protein
MTNIMTLFLSYAESSPSKKEYKRNIKSFAWAWVLVGVGERERKGSWEWGTWSKYFIHMYENRTIKSVEIVLRRRREGIKWSDTRGEINWGTLYAYM